MNKLPTTIVTGFLGSGKTTLMRHLLTHAAGRRLAVVVNEFGEVGVDGELLRQCSVGCEEDQSAPTPLYELANGCLCCTVQEEFVPVLQTLLGRRDRIDHVLIETSGLALPKPLVQAFQWPEIRESCTVDAVVTVVDGPAVLAGQFAADPERVEAERQADPSLDHDRPLRELFEDQLTAADLVIVSKTDQLGESELGRVREIVRSIAPPSVKIVAARHGALPLDVVLGLGRAAEDHIDGRHTHHDEDHEEGHEHSHELFDTIVIRPPQLSRGALLRGLEAVVSAHEVYRAKGFATIDDKPMRLVVQGVGRRFDSYFDRPWGEGEQRKTELVFIGSHLDQGEVTRTLLRGAEG